MASLRKNYKLDISGYLTRNLLQLNLTLELRRLDLIQTVNIMYLYLICSSISK